MMMMMMMMMMMIWIRDDVDIDWPTDDDVFPAFLGSSSSSSRSGLFRLLPNRPSVARSGCDERRLLHPPSFLEHHKTLNSIKRTSKCA